MKMYLLITLLLELIFKVLLSSDNQMATLFVAVPDEGAMKNAENVRINFNIIMFKLAHRLRCLRAKEEGG